MLAAYDLEALPSTEIVCEGEKLPENELTAGEMKISWPAMVA
jgi:hypothetical protein